MFSSMYGELSEAYAWVERAIVDALERRSMAERGRAASLAPEGRPTSAPPSR